MKRNYSFLLLLTLLSATVSVRTLAQNPALVISGYYANPSGSDDNKEFVELTATRNLDFSTGSYCVVFSDIGNGTNATGWANGGIITYAITLSSGTVTKGGKLYVGGNSTGTFLSGGTACISATTSTSTAGATFGNGVAGTGGTGGVMGNGGSHADGIAVFNSAASSVTNTSIPIDAIFYGTAVGSANNSFVVPTNDHYSNTQGKFGVGTNTFLAADPGGDAFIAATGSFDTVSNTFVNARTWAAVTVNTGSKRSCTTASTITLTAANTLSLTLNAPATTPFLALPNVSGVVADATDPAANLGINFNVQDNNVALPAASYTLTATSSNTTVVPISGITITKSAGSANVKINPAGIGFSTLTLTLTSNSASQTYTISYAASAATGANTVSHTGYSDGSAAVALANNYMAVVDDETNILNVYNRDTSGLPVKSYAYGNLLGLTDISGGVAREIDAEAITPSLVTAGRHYILGSLSNQSTGSFNDRPNRNRIFALDIAGTGSATTFSGGGYYANLKSDLLNWGTANSLGLAASATVGVDPKTAAGFNVEAMGFAPDGTTLYVGFRAPLLPATNRINALIAPVQNFETWFNGGNPAGSPVIGTPILMDLGGRGIREIVRQSANVILIVAGDVGSGTLSSQVYRWNGVAANAPVLLSGFNATGLNPEGLLNVYSGGVLQTNKVQLISDNGDDEYYGNGVVAKDLGTPAFKKFRSDVLTAPGAPLPIQFTQFNATLSGPNTVRLDWSFVAGEDLSTFVLERSLDGAQFDSLTTLAAGTSVADFTYTDAQLPAETEAIQALYYRVRAIANNGKGAYTNIRQVALRNRFAALEVYPNPVSGRVLQVTYSGTAALPYHIFGLNGNPVQQGVLAPGQNSLEITALPAGTYLLETVGNNLEPVRFIRR
jgi:hypothetical protein